MKITPLVPALAAAAFLAACVDNAVVTSASNIDPISLAKAPPGAAPSTCWGKTVSPAVVETVTRKVLLQPAQISSDGRIQAPPIYKDETRQEVVQPRRENWYEILCAHDLTPEFVATIQRALAARGYYRGPDSGEMDTATKNAIQRYQKAEGLKSSSLSVAAARKLGLIVVKQPEET